MRMRFPEFARVEVLQMRTRVADSAPVVATQMRRETAEPALGVLSMLVRSCSDQTVKLGNVVRTVKAFRIHQAVDGLNLRHSRNSDRSAMVKEMEKRN
jgi:hypothetical protein